MTFPTLPAPRWRLHDALRPKDEKQLLKTEPHAQQLIDWATGSTKGVEIGVAWGWTAWSLLNSLPQLHLHLVDMWSHPGVFPWFQQLVAPFKDRISILQGDSSSQAVHVQDEAFDWVFVDANHYEAGCFKDLMAWWPKVRSGGFMAGHDYQKLSHDGVKRALTAFCKEKGLTYTLGTPESDCWRIDKP